MVDKRTLASSSTAIQESAEEPITESPNSPEKAFIGIRRKLASRQDRYRLDDLERKIIAQLTQDGRKPFQAIARELNVDEKTVRNRVGKLREIGALQIIPTAEVNVLQGCIVAIIAVNISSEGRRDVEGLAQRISELPMVSWVGILLGQHDLLVEAVVESWEDLTEFEYVVLPSVSGISTTASYLVLSHYGKRGVPFVESILKEQTR